MSRQENEEFRLTAEKLAAERGGEPVVRDQAFELRSGELLAITGPNGAGKSTLLRTIAGLLPVSSGTVRLRTAGGAEREIAAHSHYLGHFNAMKPALTVSENLDFWRNFGGDVLTGTGDALSLVGLADIGGLPFGYLSAGQRRRVAIARLLLNHRPLWLLDEPTTGLDTASVRRFADLMAGHLRQGGMIVAATHQPLGLKSAAELRLGLAA